MALPGVVGRKGTRSTYKSYLFLRKDDNMTMTGRPANNMPHKGSWTGGGVMGSDTARWVHSAYLYICMYVYI